MLEELKLPTLNMKTYPQNRTGFTLIEMLVSLVIVAIGVLGVYAAVAKYSRNTQQEKDNLVASYLCEEGIEIIKNIRDTNWVSGATSWKLGLVSSQGMDCTAGCEADFDFSDGKLSAWTTGNYLYLDNSSGGTGLYRYISSPDVGDVKTDFQRKIVITEVGDDELDITVTVYWEDQTKSMVVKENIYNWR